MKKAVSLIELILAITLLMTIILSATSLDIASRYFFKSSNLKAKVLNEASLILEHIGKQAFFSVGEGGLNPTDNNLKERGFSVTTNSSTNTLMIRQDLQNSSYYYSLNTPQDYTDDRCVKYVFDSNNHTITYYRYPNYDCSGSASQTITLTHKLVSLSASGYPSYIDYDSALNPFLIAFHVRLRNDPTKPKNNKTNPQVELNSSFFIH